MTDRTTERTEEKNKRERKLPRGRKRAQRILTFGAVCALFLVLFSAGVFLLNKDSIRLKGNYTVSLLGTSEHFSGNCRLRYEKDGKEMVLSDASRSMRLVGTPVYAADGSEAVLTSQMIFTNYHANRMERMNHFGHASYKNGSAWLSRDGKKQIEVGSGYLYDGKNTFLFLEPVTLSWGEETRSLSPLSYVTALNRQGFSYYDPTTGAEAYVQLPEGAVYASAEGGGYSLNLSNDIAELANGKSLLLAPNPETFSLIK